MATIAEKDMPAPRLELRWKDETGLRDGYTVVCVYSLVLKLDKYDRRAERYDEDGQSLDGFYEYPVEMGKTLSDHDAESRYHSRPDCIDTPFRDGAHAHWDTRQLGNLPIYAVAAGRAMLIEAE